MSTEIQIGFPCPHLIVEEPVSLGEDKRSMVTLAPVANAGSVRVLVDDSLFVPSSGLYSQALLQGGVGPYRIRRCKDYLGPDGNKITVTASGGTVTLSLPESERISVNKLIEKLKMTSLNDLVTITSRNGAIAFGDTAATGTVSFVRVSGKGADALGFTQKGARGQMLYPGWTLVAREDTFPSASLLGTVTVPARYPRFVKPLLGNPDIKVTYSAMPDRCPRCQATYVENDYRFNADGGVITIENEDLLYQACLKAILTRKGSNPYHPGYGSNVMTRVGRKRLAATAALLQEDIMGCLSRVQSVQNSQRRYQQVRDRERLYRILNVSTRPSGTDPTTILIDVSVTNGTNSPVTLNIVYSAPGAVALAGSNGKSLGIDARMSTTQSLQSLVNG